MNQHGKKALEEKKADKKYNKLMQNYTTCTKCGSMYKKGTKCFCSKVQTRYINGKG